ncbi:MAG: hypothetical protein J6I45_06905, partial [Clostridia bacterium]|nr:hypothetical protein [Clostridia bacterium]
MIKKSSSGDVPKKPVCDSQIVYPPRALRYKPSSPIGIDVQSNAPYSAVISAEVFPIKSDSLKRLTLYDEQAVRITVIIIMQKARLMFIYVITAVS